MSGSQTLRWYHAHLNFPRPRITRRPGGEVSWRELGVPHAAAHKARGGFSGATGTKGLELSHVGI